MKKSFFTEEQIAFALGQAEQGAKVAEVCRKTGAGEPALYGVHFSQTRLARSFLVGLNICIFC